MLAPVLIGEKVTLRPLEMVDALLTLKWGKDSKVMRYLPLTFCETVEEEIKWWRKMRKSLDTMIFAIDANATGECIGNCGIRKIDYENLSANLGIVIGASKLHGKGYGTEAVSILRDFVFGEMKFHRFELDVFEENLGGIHCYKNCGFKTEGKRRDAFRKKGKYCTLLQMSILRPEWEKLKHVKYKKV